MSQRLDTFAAVSATAERQVACAELARRQHGVLSVDQALEVGMSRSAISRLVSSGRWRWELPRVLVPGRDELPLMGRAASACIWAADGAVSHLTAAAIWGLVEAGPDVVHLTVRRWLRAPRGLAIHCSADIQSQEVQGVRVTTVARTMLDLAGVAPAEQLETILEHALRRRLTSAPSLERFVATVGGQGRSGTAALRALVKRYGEAPTESFLERKVQPLFARNRLPRPESQFSIVVEGERYRLDFAYPSVHVAVEAHGFQWHSGRKSWNHDLRRMNALARAGWTVMFITSEDLADDAGRRFFGNLRRVLNAKGFFPPTLPLFENVGGKFRGGRG